MAITTLDGAIAGYRQPVPFFKTGITMAAVSAMRGYTPWYVAGNPGAASANAAGINGAAVSGAVAGSILRANPGAGNAYLGRLAMQASTSGSFLLIDRLWHNSALVTTSTSAQAITPATLPARDLNASTNGQAVMAAMEWSGVGGAGTPTVSLTYTDQDGNAGAVATLTGVTAPPVGTFEIFSLAAGDTGIRAPTSFIQSATRTSGTMHLVLFRVLAQLECLANIPSAIDVLTSGRPQIFNHSVLQAVWIPSATTGTIFAGTYIETHG